MTYSRFDKVYTQLQYKPAKWKKFLKHNSPKKRSCGRSIRRCIRCGRIRAHIGRYAIHMCRQCFREVAQGIGFRKFS
ncbi:30S ribosomal protein S14 [Candidatus Woesearchaeota archaeon]|nr:30S ribosomal protein S14 [Candidatus Woesearchaeota archaeon]